MLRKKHMLIVTCAAAVLTCVPYLLMGGTAGKLIEKIVFLPTVFLLLLVADRWSEVSPLVVIPLFSALWVILIFCAPGIHLHGRWLLQSSNIKARALAECVPADELHHAFWEDEGFFPDPQLLYVVYDPHDQLVVSREDVKTLAGIPCNVEVTQRLEPKWYLVVFPRNATWESCRRTKTAG
jgi:hypothetical protein